MAETNEVKRDKINSLDFGIEDTIDAGDKEVLNAFFTGGASGNPDDVIDKDEETPSSTTQKTTTKAVVKQQQSQKKDEKPESEKVTEKALDADDLFENDQEPEEEKQVEKEEIENTEAGQNQPTMLASLAADFQDMGIFEKDEANPIDPNLTPEEFLKVYNTNFNKKINDTVESFLGRYGDDYREMFDAVFVNGVDPKEYVQAFIKLQDVSNLDMTVESNQEKVYREFYKRQGFPDDKIEAKIQKAKVNGDLEEDSTEYHKFLVDQDAKELETMKEEKEKRTLEERRAKQAFAQSINKVLVEKIKEKEFEGIPLSDQIAKSAFEFLTHEKYKLPTGEPLTEFDKAILELKRPENATLKLKLGLLLMNKLDLSKVKIKEKNENTTQAFKWATRTSQSTTKGGKVSQNKETEAFI